ncbi:MAG TPA: type II toxin-antitoxin system VapC family toxin [Pyrinomonadaceae bacterium]|nr:type II toxin-antitoxin system VapC family toxin [Pyrinomonadaceae bacterium]
MDYVLDTFALMAYLRREKNFQIVRNIILETLQGKSRSFMSVINLGELYYMQARKSGTIKAENSVKFVKRAGILIEPATTARVMNAAKIKATVSLSYADAFAASLALELNATLVTGDSEYKPLEPNLKILWL